ncbi:MAG: hypothetical protein HGB10_03955 [Coriobacteriia bacterium]|nr:hypothetical protein [Coriobacteriia bacterium]
MLFTQSESITGRHIARLAGVSQAGAARALEHLADLGVVTRRSVGRAVLHELARENPLVQRIVTPVFEAERNLPVMPIARAEADPSVSARVNPHVRPHLAALEAACRRHRVIASALFGSATQVEQGVVPNDLDILVTFEPLEPRMKAQEYAALAAELESIMGMPVDVMVSTAVNNAYLADEIERSKVVLYEVA